MTQLASPESLWTPAETLRDHSRAPIPPHAFFPENPPPEIGDVTSAETTLSTLKKPRSTAVRLIIALICAAPLPLFTYYGYLHDGFKPEAINIGLLAGAFAGLIAFFATAPRRVCSYVGQLGAVRFTVIPNKSPKVHQLLFQNAAELRSATTHSYTNGIYTGTRYSYSWTNPNGQRIFVLKGSHRSKNKPPKRLNPLHFADAAEAQWSQFLLERAANELAEKGAITFHVSKGKTIRLAPGFIEFDWSGQTARLDAPDIAQISLSKGQFLIKSKDARWFSSKGRFSFTYAQMPNARVFLLAIQRFLPNVPKTF